MSIFTRSALDVFNPVSAFGQPRGGDMGEVQRWGIEVEAILQAAASSGGALVFNARAILYATLGYPSNTLAWVIGDPVPGNNGIYLKSGGVGVGLWLRVGDLPYQVITLSIAGTANALLATSSLPVPAADRAALLIFDTPLANTGPATMAINGDAALPILDRYGSPLTASFFVAGGAAIGVKSNGAIRTFLDTDAGVAKAAAEAAAAAASASAGTAIAARDQAAASRDIVQGLILGGGPSFPTTDGGGGPLQNYSRFFLNGQPDPLDNGEYYYLDGTWHLAGVLPAAFRRVEIVTVDAGMVSTGIVPVPGGYAPGTGFQVLRHGQALEGGADLGDGTADDDADYIAADGINAVFLPGRLSLGDRLTFRIERTYTIAILAASDVVFTPTGGIASTNAQTAIAELDTEKAPKASPSLSTRVDFTNSGYSASIRNDGSDNPALYVGAAGAADGDQIKVASYNKGTGVANFTVRPAFSGQGLATLAEVSAAGLPLGYLAGMQMANNASDAVNDIDFTAGIARDSTNAVSIVCAAMTKRLDAAWAAGTNQGGLDTGSKANSTWYHCFAICKADGSGGDFIFSTTLAGPALPATYAVWRYIGSILTDGAGAILGFQQDGDLFSWNAIPTDFNSQVVTANTPVVITLQVPRISGIIANVQGMVMHASVVGTNVFVRRIGQASNGNCQSARTQVANIWSSYRTSVRVNGSAQIHGDANQNSTNLIVGVESYINRRGRDS